MKNNSFYLFGMSVSIVTFLWVVISIFFTFYPYKVFKSYYTKNPMVKSVYQPGETLLWKSDVENFTSGTLVDVTSAMVDGTVTNFAPRSYVTIKGRKSFTNSSLSVPSNASPGIYHIESISVFHVNPFRTIVIKTQTEDFQVATPSGVIKIK